MAYNASTVTAFPTLGTGVDGADLYEVMVATSTDEMAYVDTQHVVRAVNPQYVEAARRRLAAAGVASSAKPLTVDNLVGHHLSQLFGQEFFLSSILPHLERALSGQPVGFQRWVEEPGVPARFLHSQYLPHRDGAGDVVGVVAVVRDLTSEKHAQAVAAELAGHEAVVAGRVHEVATLLTEQLAENLGVDRASLWLFEQDGQILRCIDLYDPIAGSHHSGEILHQEDFPSYFAAVLKGRVIDAPDALDDARTVELAVRDQPRHVCGILDGPVRSGGRVAGVVCAEVIGQPRLWQAAEVSFVAESAAIFAQSLSSNERRRLERRLYQAEKMESLGLMAGGVAHDFNNLLVGILANAEMMLAEMSTDGSAHRRLSGIRDASLRASDLCAQMLACTGKQDFHPEPVDLSQLVADVLAAVHKELPPGTRLVQHLADGLPPVSGGVAALHQALSQLVENAMEALEGGGEVVVATGVEELRGTEEGFVGEAPSKPGCYLVVMVGDDGCGMDATMVERVFDPFYSTKFTGRGLGLASVLGTIRSHDGGIRVETALGRGTTVTVYLPCA